MLEEEALGTGWQIWTHDSEIIVLVFRPDIFDGDNLPAECLPTITVTQGVQTRRPKYETATSENSPWTVLLYLEPDVSTQPILCDTRENALIQASTLSQTFSAGAIPIRELYQVPRHHYLDTLEDVIAREH